LYPLDETFHRLHRPRIEVCDVHSRGRGDSLGRSLRLAATQATALLGFHVGASLHTLAVSVLDGLMLALDLTLGLLQPSTTRAAVGHLRRQLITTRLPQLLLLSPIDKLGFG
jgi:hypothetical protein